MDKSYIHILKENDPLFYKKGYSKAQKKLSRAGDEELQALARAGDEDLESAASRFGMGSGVDYYPLTAMGKPFDVSFGVKTFGSDIPASWMGEKSLVKGKTTSDKNFNATIWLSPDSFKKIKSGKLENDFYRFKIIKISGNDLKETFLLFKAEQINIKDKVTGEISPRLILNKKYDIGFTSQDEPSIGDENEDGGENDISVPEEIASGKNRNEIFRFLLNRFGGYNGKIVYGDGFKTLEQSREYNKLQRAVQSGKEDKSKLKDFREQAGRDVYSMMISNLRKSYPKNFMEKLSKAFPEFNIKYTKESLEESFKTNLLEEENSDKYKRWSLVFPNKVIGKKHVDVLDKNIKEFMAAVKKWFAVPVKIGKKSHSYNISYDKDKVNDYWNKFYGTKKESKISLFNVLNEITGGILLEEDKKGKAELVFNRIAVKGMRKGEKYGDEEIDFSSIVSGKDSLKISDYRIDDKYITEIEDGAKKAGILDKDVLDILDTLKNLKNKEVFLKQKNDILIIKLGKTTSGKSLYLNVPIKNNGKNIKSLLKLLTIGSDFNNCGFAYAKPNKPFVKDGIDLKLKLSN